MTDSSPTEGVSTAERVDEGRAALLAGDKARAQQILLLVVEQEPDHAEAWLWLSGTYAEPDQMARCLRRVLALEPSNQVALEGLAWIHESYGTGDAPAVPAATVAAPVDVEPVPEIEAPRPVAPSSTPESRSGLLEASLHVAATGALLGLLRLVSSLRPGTLLLIRGPTGAIGVPAALGLAIVVAVLHALALLAAWWFLCRAIARARGDRPGDLLSSLVQTGKAFVPGYLVAGALVIVALGLGWGQQRWSSAVTIVWAILALATVLILWRLAAVARDMGLVGRREGISILWIGLPALLTATAGVVFAGVIAQVLLRAL